MNGTLCMESRTAGSLRELLQVIRSIRARYETDGALFTLPSAVVFADFWTTQTTELGSVIWRFTREESQNV